MVGHFSRSYPGVPWPNEGMPATALSRRKSGVFSLMAGLVQVRDGQGVRQLPGRCTLHSHRAGGGHVAPELVDATPGGNPLGHGMTVGSHSAAPRCGPASLESVVSQVAALLWYPCFG
jgi:hypothetical protein